MNALFYEKRAWANMNSRCANPKTRLYHRYGGRGIKVGYKSFADFFADVGPRPTPSHSIDRINNDGNYCAGNCRWALRHQQARNTSTNHTLEFQGQTKTITDWAAEVGIGRNTLLHRIKRGWPAHEALTIKTSKRSGSDHAKAKLDLGSVLKIRASSKSDADLAKEFGVSRKAVWAVRRGENWNHV